MCDYHEHAEDNDNDFISSHTKSMRKAAEYCVERLQSIGSIKNVADNSAATPPGEVTEVLIFEKVPSDFLNQYSKFPCCIRDTDWNQEHFGGLHRLWCTSDGTINRGWWQEHHGNDSLPVRMGNTLGTDVDGRAYEAPVEHMSMKNWFKVLHVGNEQCYLKDWHWQLTQSQLPYTVPKIFQTDLLNALLTRFTDGDYRFVYWGPDGSTTPRHSDVLASFSWSYTVVGSKEWTFYTETKTIHYTQHAGECMFVPALLPHSVRNVGDTLSVNHNWITVHNIQATWMCLRQDMDAVSKDLATWSTDFDAGARENMLRGCAGLDVTAFLIMIVFGIVHTDNVEERARLCNHLQRLNSFDSLEERLIAVLESKSLVSKLLDACTKTYG